ncbi:MAG: aminoacetone oxidase family FAD-binding enzyme, partial [Chitinophagia bacterium]|jgi:predicted Rossmann fold flavoprotein|nr:aminoacetone oxidase family FAD-binding enzyme [Chitinophagia bacterium]
LLEKSGKVLSKVKVSGGGRCNVTHESEEVDDLLHAYPRGKAFMRKTLHQFSPNDTIQWFKERGVEVKVEADGRMFPVSNQSQTIIDCFLKEAAIYNVEILFNTELQSIHQLSNQFEITLKSDSLKKSLAYYICIATGGFPKLEGFSFLSEIGIEIETPVPSLFTFNIADKKLHALMGVSVSSALVKIPALKMEQLGALLVTHWGLSGPAVLKLSSYAARELHKMEYDFEILVNWCPDYNESSLLEKLKEEKEFHKGIIGTKNILGLSTRLWEFLLEKAAIASSLQWQDVPQKKLVQLSKVVCGDRYAVKGKTTFKEEFVTSGGVQLNEIDPFTMESHKIPHLFFAGEVINIDGITGGYNFQHAWSSGMIAARAIARDF